MSTLVCVPIMVREVETAIRLAHAARVAGADLVEYRLDECFHGTGESEDQQSALEVVAQSPLPCIATCRPTWEGGLYDGPEDERVSLFEALAMSEAPPAYLDVELKAYTASANLRQKINLAVQHPKQVRDVRTRLILSMHDFEGRPDDLSRRLTTAYAEPAVSVVKVAFRARSLRDNLELFDILRQAPKPTIALGMGEFGLMSRVLAPKFGGFLTFASLTKQEVTAPGQPTVEELLNQFRFRSIGPHTAVYGVMGWPVGHSMSPLVHNAGFDAIGHDGVYLPMPIAAGDDAETNRVSFETTLDALWECSGLGLCGASVTIPFKECAASRATSGHDIEDIRSVNTLVFDWGPAGPGVFDADCGGIRGANTDVAGIRRPLTEAVAPVNSAESLRDRTIAIMGAGGVAKAAVWAAVSAGAHVVLFNRSRARAVDLAEVMNTRARGQCVEVRDPDELPSCRADAFINCTSVGMAGGPDPDGLSLPVPDLLYRVPQTVFFDTVYNPIETPMLQAAREHGCTTIDGVQMFVIQAAEQFRLWTGQDAPVELFERLVRERLGGGGGGGA